MVDTQVRSSGVADETLWAATDEVSPGRLVAESAKVPAFDCCPLLIAEGHLSSPG